MALKNKLNFIESMGIGISHIRGVNHGKNEIYEHGD